MPATGDSLNYYFAVNGYMVVETDDAPAATYGYYLYVNKFGQWYLMRREAISSTAVEYRFTKGDLDYSTAWTNRINPVVAYNFPNVIFKDL